MKKKAPKPEPKTASDADALKRLFVFQFQPVFQKSIGDLPPGEQHLLIALQRFYAYRHNGFLLAEALELCTTRKVNPPVWVLAGINEGLQRFIKDNVVVK